MRQRVRSEQTGFTLVELMIALVLVGVLAGLVAPTAFQARDKAYLASSTISGMPDTWRI
jgi:prepilin-type N-terminal cleavage/methylation domain-containing protein